MKMRKTLSFLLALALAAGFAVLPALAADHDVDISNPFIFGDDNNIYQFSDHAYLELAQTYKYIAVEVDGEDQVWGIMFSYEQNTWHALSAVPVLRTSYYYADLAEIKSSCDPAQSEWGSLSIGMNGGAPKKVYFTDTIPGGTPDNSGGGNDDNQPSTPSTPSAPSGNAKTGDTSTMVLALFCFLAAGAAAFILSRKAKAA